MSKAVFDIRVRLYKNTTEVVISCKIYNMLIWRHYAAIIKSYKLVNSLQIKSKNK